MGFRRPMVLGYSIQSTAMMQLRDLGAFNSHSFHWTRQPTKFRLKQHIHRVLVTSIRSNRITHGSQGCSSGVTAWHSSLAARLLLQLQLSSQIPPSSMCRDSRSAKSIETRQGWLHKRFSIQPHPTYRSTLKICRVELYTELFHAVHPTLFLCFLLICYPYILLNFNVFILVQVVVWYYKCYNYKETKLCSL